MTIKQILKDNIESVVRCVYVGSAGYSPEYEYHADKRVMGEIAQCLVNETNHDDPARQKLKEAALFDDLINHFGHERIGKQIIQWYKAPMTVADRGAAAALLQGFLSKMLIEYAEYLAEEYSNEMVSYYEEIQRSRAESRERPEEV